MYRARADEGGFINKVSSLGRSRARAVEAWRGQASNSNDLTAEAPVRGPASEDTTRPPQPAARQEEKSAPKVRAGLSRRTIVLGAVAALAVIAGGWYGAQYWTVGRFQI